MKFISARKSYYLVSIIFSILSLLFLISCFILKNIHDSRVENWEYVEGTIIDINHEEETVYVSYIIDGVGYSDKINYYSSILKEFQKIDLLVSNDGTVYANELKIVSFVFLGLGGLFGIIGGITFYIIKRKDKIKEICLQSGTKKRCVVDKISYTHSKNGMKRMYKMVVLFDDKKYKSEHFYLKNGFKELKNPVVDVYFLESNKYYIDINSYRENNYEV